MEDFGDTLVFCNDIIASFDGVETNCRGWNYKFGFLFITACWSDVMYVMKAFKLVTSFTLNFD